MIDALGYTVGERRDGWAELESRLIDAFAGVCGLHPWGAWPPNPSTVA